jgi:hypothetical protein
VAVFPAIFHSCRALPPPYPAREHAEKNASYYLFMTRSAERVSRVEDTYLFVSMYLTSFMNSVSFPVLSFLFYFINISAHLAFKGERFFSFLHNYYDGYYEVLEEKSQMFSSQQAHVGSRPPDEE